VVNVFVQVLFEQLDQALSVDKVSAAVSALVVELHIRAAVIQFATLLQPKQTPLCTKLCGMLMMLAALNMLGSLLAC
jgi:hypothetical protein